MWISIHIDAWDRGFCCRSDAFVDAGLLDQLADGGDWVAIAECHRERLVFTRWMIGR